ncbi:acetyltransferase [Sulfurimonas sp. HSL1-2]|uniref:acetyltransferase n=1 Tax=Thiomicrolovo zhangzhouensis TaxID=3131933 RepID=UPI0031F8C0E3
METTKRIGIYGVGGHGRVVAQIARACGYTDILWIDDAVKEGACDFDTFKTANADIPVALGVGSNAARQRVFEKLVTIGAEPLTLIHPSAVIAADAAVGSGSVIMPLAVVNTGATIGEGVIVNSGAVVEHDCRIGAFAHLSPNVALAGAVSVGLRTHVGIGSSVVQGVSIGSDAVIAAGSAVIASLPDGVMAAGVPAVIKKELKQ